MERVRETECVCVCARESVMMLFQASAQRNGACPLIGCNAGVVSATIGRRVRHVFIVSTITRPTD